MSARKRVLPIQPLLDLTELLGPTEIASLCGVSPRAVHRWRSGQTTTIAVHDADRIAIRLGTHPAHLWGEQWWQIPNEMTAAEYKRSQRAAKRESADA